MALVAYDYGSGSENEEDGAAEPSAVINTAKNLTELKKDINGGEISEIKTTEDNQNITDFGDTSEDVSVPEILSHLPKTKSTAVNVVEDTLEDFVPKYQPTASKEKKPQKVKITIPALSEFEEEDEPEQKKKKPSQQKGSSLLAMLPPVRGTVVTSKSFVPNVLKNRPPASDKKTNSLVPHAVRKKAEEAKLATIKKITRISQQGSDAESDDDIETPETFDDEMWHKVCGPKSRPKPQIIEPEIIEPEPMQTINIAPEPVKPYDGLDNAAFKELVGKSKRPVNIKLIDINEEEIIPDKELWLTKSLTDPDTVPKQAVEDPVDPTRKKKHHITYLAEQAKANEQELQGQWSANKFARNQTRAKYGF